MPKVIISISIEEEILEKLKIFRDKYYHKNYSAIINILLKQRLKEIEDQPKLTLEQEKTIIKEEIKKIKQAKPLKE